MDEYGNAARWPLFRDTLLEKNIEPVPWYTDSFNIRYCPVEAKNVIGEVEGHDDRRNFLDSLPLLPPSIHKAIITDFNGFLDSAGNYMPELAQPFVDAGVTCITESYLPDNVTRFPSNMEFAARDKLGFNKVQAAWGCYLGGPQSSKPGQPFTEADYHEWSNLPHWIWIAENVV